MNQSMYETNDFQKYGDFSPDGREFVIRRFDTPRPWINYAWNDKLLISIDQRGRGTNLHRDQAGHRTVPIRDRFVYVKDRASGRYWTIGWDPVRLPFEHYVCRHALGYSTLECLVDEIWCEWTITASADEPAEIWSVRVVNRGKTARALSVYPAVEFDLGGWVPYGTLENYSVCRYNGRQSLVALNQSDERPAAKNHAVFSAEERPHHYETRKREFLGGYYESLSSPNGVLASQLSDRDAATEDFIGAFQYDIALESTGGWQRHFSVGCVGGESEEPLVQGCASATAFQKGMEAARRRTDHFSRVDFTLPDEKWTHLFNIWGKQQLFLLKEYARVFLIGFRDTLQDAKSLCAYAPELAADSIFTALKYQFRDGSAMRGWCPDDHHKYADSGVWLPMAVAEYLRETNDLDFLERQQTYRDGGEATVWEHVIQSMLWFFDNLGSHGLPKLYFGDWNDSLNIGRGGKGESVWLGMALLVALGDTGEIAGKIGDEVVAGRMETEARRLQAVLEGCAWDGEWYLRGFDDAGDPVGSGACEEGKIFSEPQSWAFFAGLEPARLAKVAASVTTHLRTDTGLVVCRPPFSTYKPAYGRISSMPAGWGENGSCYCHVTAFQAVADCLARDGDAALSSLASIVPFNGAISSDQSWLEPYAFSNMFRGPDHPRPGATFKGWTSGTVPWVLLCVTHYLLGIRPDYDALVIDPVLPSSWENVRVSRTFRGVGLDIEMHNPNRLHSASSRAVVKVNGKIQGDNRIRLQDFPNGRHQVVVEIVPQGVQA